MAVILPGLCGPVATASEHAAAGSRRYTIVEGQADARTYNGFRRYHAACSHCHGPDGLGSTVAAPLVDRLPEIELFRRIVHEGVTTGVGVMQGFGGDPNIAPYVDDIYAYLQARADGMLGRGRPVRMGDLREPRSTRLRPP